MKPDELEERMRALEYFHGLRLLPGAWAVVRVDGRGFSRFTEARFEKPFDPAMSELMVRTAQALLEGMGGVYAYTESDEISVLFPPRWDFFDREVEKIVSLSASIATGAFTHAFGEPVQFDSRIWLGVDVPTVVEYFRWRQSDAGRCALNGWCYWRLRQAGKSVAEATAALEGASFGEKNELLFQQGVNFNDLPLWQRRGVGLYWETYEKEGFNPMKGERVTALRRRVKVDRELPMRDEYARFIAALIAG